ncbi:MAG: hypothetical protein P4L51_19935 [Puia sp.]|nr:hypothetical protein [Puia sp.]
MVSLTSGQAADGLALKTKPIHDHWHVLSASNDSEHVPFILDHTATLLGKYETPTIQQVLNAMSRSIDAKVNEHVRVKALRNYQMTGREFWLEGRKNLTDKTFDRLALKIEKTEKLDCDFLVCGFDERGDGHLFKITTESDGVLYDSPGFWAIGTGVDSVLNLMAFYADRYMLTKHTTTLSHALYLVCAAKFMAEQTHEGSIGRQTLVSIHEFNKPVRWLAPAGISMARKKWEREGMPRIPKNLSQLGEYSFTLDEMGSSPERMVKLFGKRKRINAGYELG